MIAEGCGVPCKPLVGVVGVACVALGPGGDTNVKPVRELVRCCSVSQDFICVCKPSIFCGHEAHTCFF